jgi:hypothetical protein
MVDARSHWSPFGLGYELRGNFLREHQIYGMTNATDFAPYWTLGYRHLTWVPTGISNLSWTWSGEIWQQPSLRNPIDQQSQMGGSFQLAGKWTFQDTPIAILGNLGYKTEGFSPTQPFYSDRLLGLGATWAL